MTRPRRPDPDPDQLTAHQRELLDAWLPGLTVVRDHSWRLVGTTVLEVRWAGSRFIVKAGDDRDHHLAREARAHREWLEPWTSIDRAPRLAHGDTDAKLLVTHHLPGELVANGPAADDPQTYRQAGVLLALLHAQAGVTDPDYEARENARSLSWLDRPHRISGATEQRLRAEIASWPTPPAQLVPTHGDWQPRNWVVHRGVVSVIDFGRADLRAAMSDLARMAAGEFRRDPALEAAFLDGYGRDPREPAAWHRNRIREAIGTAVWAHQVRDEAFEAHGHRMIADALDDSPA